MSVLRAVLDRLNDIEATIAQVSREAGPEPGFSVQLSLQSLESRRDMLKEELIELSHQEFIDVCDYKIIPTAPESYAMSAVTSAWQDFQETLSLVFSSLETGAARVTSKLGRDVIEKTQLNFGYAYQGSLGIVMTMRNDRFLLEETTLDRSVAAVFNILRANTPDKIKEVRATFGIPVVRKLYHIAKTHSHFKMAADIKWVRGRETKSHVLAQPPEFAEIVRLIEDKSDIATESFEVMGALVAWNTVTKTFMLEFPQGEPISGHWAEDFEGTQRQVPALYEARLTKKTVVRYAEERDQVSWLLHSLHRLRPN